VSKFSGLPFPHSPLSIANRKNFEEFNPFTGKIEGVAVFSAVDRVNWTPMDY